MSHTHYISYISNWKDWEEFCAGRKLDPRDQGNQECSFDLGGGDTLDVEYIGDYPEKEE